MKRWAWLLLPVVALGACRKETPRRTGPPPLPGQKEPPPKPREAMPWDKGGPQAEGETYVLTPVKTGRDTIEAAKAAGLLDVDLGDEWAPFIFSESDPVPSDAGVVEPKPNLYRGTFIALANNRTTPDELFFDSPDGRRAILAAANVPPRSKKQPPTPEEKKALDAARRVLRAARDHNFLEVYGIPPTLAVLRARLDEDRGRNCYGEVDLPALASFQGMVSYQNRDQAKREFDQANADAVWAAKILAAADAGTLPTSTAPQTPTPGAPAAPAAAPGPFDDPKIVARLERFRRGQARLKAIKAVQQRLVCEGLLSPKTRFVEGMFDLHTHEALADWERKNDIFGWGFLGDETLVELQRPPLDLHFETFKRILMERVADAAGIIEDGSVSKGKKPATYKDATGVHPVPDLIGDHTTALLKALRAETPQDMAAFFERLPEKASERFHVAIAAPPLPPYYGPEMDLAVEIDRGDIWYDFPWDANGKPIVQKREKYPALTLFVNWQKQKIPLGRWRTTIGSWRSELGADGKVYYKYKNSDVGPRIWKNIVAAPVWIPPDGTPAKDLLTRKVFDRNVGPVNVVNTDVMGPGFQSAYGLAMAIHLKVQPGGGLFDNQIRTHGSVDYTSIARRFSHGCHRMVNNRAVRLFDFVLRHRRFTRTGQTDLGPMLKKFTVEEKEYAYKLTTRGYYYELTPPVPVMVHEGRVVGEVKKPITAFIRKPGVDYGPDPSDGDAATSTATPAEPAPSVVNP